MLLTLFSKQPKKLILLDAIGALLSAFLLGVVLVRWQHLVGISVPTLYLLAAIPVLFILYDLFYFAKKDHNLSRPLKTLAIMNAGYCILSICTACYEHTKITPLGWAYLSIEILLVLSIALVEYKVSRQLGRS